MSIFVDDFGSWDDVGTIKLSATNWQEFPGVIYSGELFRFTYTTDWDFWNFSIDDRVNIRCRFIYGSSQKIVSSSFLLFPKREKETRQYLFPQKFKDDGINERLIEAKAYRRYGKYVGNQASIADIDLKIEYLL